MKQIQPFQKHWLQIISIVVCRLNPITCRDICSHNGPLARYVKLLVAHAPGMPGTFSAPLRISDPDMHHGTCVTHVPWCMPGSLTSGFLWSRWRGKCSRHFRRMRNQQFYVSGKRPMATNFRHRRTQSSWDQECSHYSDVIMNTMTSQIIGISIVCSTFCSGVDKKTETSKLRVTGLCKGKSSVAGEFPAQKVSNAENISIWWRHYETAWTWRTWRTSRNIEPLQYLRKI